MSADWARVHQAAVADYGPISLTAENFEARARDLLARRLARQGRGAGELSLAALLARTAGTDLVLATAVEGGSAEAQAILETRYLTRLAGLLKARDPALSPEAAAQEVRAALSDWSAPGDLGVAATRIGTYDGSGGLFAWLGVMLLSRGTLPPALDSLADDISTAFPGTAVTPCPDANLLAGHAEARLETRERAAVDAHLPSCAACRDVLDRLRAAGVHPVVGLPPEEPLPAHAPAAPVHFMPGPSRLPPPRAGASWKAWTAIALIIGGILVASMSAGRRPLWDVDARRQDTEHEVFVAARQLVGQQPGYFGEFVPYERDELEKEEPPPERRGFLAAHPRGPVFEKTPRFIWSGAPGAGRFRVTLKSADGEEAWNRAATGTSLDWPADVPPLRRETAWVWDVRPDGADGPLAKAEFHVTTEQEEVRWNRHKERIGRATTDVGVRAVLTAQVALRRGHVWEAFTLIREHLERYPKDDYGRALLDHIVRVYGLHP